jgi:hypothetical protein
MAKSSEPSQASVRNTRAPRPQMRPWSYKDAEQREENQGIGMEGGNSPRAAKGTTSAKPCIRHATGTVRLVKAVDSCWHPRRTCVVGWHGDCSAKIESGWSRSSPCRFSGTPEHFPATTYRISSRIFLRLQTAGKSIQWKAIRACPQGDGGTSAFQPCCPLRIRSDLLEKNALGK